MSEAERPLAASGSDHDTLTSGEAGPVAETSKGGPAERAPGSKREPKRQKTLPYGVPVVRGAEPTVVDWRGGMDPSLFGLFESDGPASSIALADRGRAGRQVLSNRLFAPNAPPSGKRSLRSGDQIVPGTIIDRYRVEELIGGGGFASVYRATHVVLKRSVALKIMKPEVLRRKPELCGQLAHEAELAARLDHPNVVRMIDFCQNEVGAFLVMECVDGESLAGMLRRGPLAPAAVIDIGVDLCRGLRAGLARGLIHRDVKPANVMVTRGGSAKLVDFGLAVSFAELSDSRGAIVGTRAYAAPEQVEAPRTVDFRADIYSLGATLYCALTGVPPFDIGDSSDSLDEPPPSVAPAIPLGTACPTALRRLVPWLLSRQRDRRPASYDIVEEELERGRRELSEQSGGAT